MSTGAGSLVWSFPGPPFIGLFIGEQKTGNCRGDIAAEQRDKLEVLAVEKFGILVLPLRHRLESGEAAVRVILEKTLEKLARRRDFRIAEVGICLCKCFQEMGMYEFVKRTMYVLVG